jgi:hypothetical protein
VDGIWQGQIKLDPIDDDIPFLDHSEPHPLARCSVRIIKREATITIDRPRTAYMSSKGFNFIVNVHSAQALDLEISRSRTTPKCNTIRSLQPIANDGNLLIRASLPREIE